MKKQTNHTLPPTPYNLTIGWLYPDLMSIYGDRGNIIALTKRCEWRGIEVEVRTIDQTTSDQRLKTCDLLFMGGAQDRQQTIVAEDLMGKSAKGGLASGQKKEILSKMIEDNVPGLYICGGFQYLGKYYKEADGTVIEQLGILDVWTENPGGKRLIGNIAIEIDNLPGLPRPEAQGEGVGEGLIVVGFENHGGRTRLGKDVKPLGKVIKGFGSNAEDHTEGAIYKNSIGTYLHGPILPKNPLLSDWLIQKALERKYNKTVILGSESNSRIKDRSWTSQDDIIFLEPLDDTLANKAHDAVLKRM